MTCNHRSRRTSSLYAAFEQQRNKTSNIMTLSHADLDSSLNMIIIQLSTRYHCFSLTHFDLIFFCLHVCIGFCLAFLYINPISFSWFLLQFCHKHQLPFWSTCFSFVFLNIFYFLGILVWWLLSSTSMSSFIFLTVLSLRRDSFPIQLGL